MKKSIFFGVWVQYFVWNFTQNFVPVHLKYAFYEMFKVQRIMIALNYGMLSLSETHPGDTILLHLAINVITDLMFIAKITSQHHLVHKLMKGGPMCMAQRKTWVTPVLTNWSLQWRHNGRDGVSNHLPHDCLRNRLFRSRSKKTSELLVTGLCAGNSSVTGEFLAQMASNAETFPYDDVITVIPEPVLDTAI